MRPESLIYTPKRLKRDEEHPRLFYRMFAKERDGFITRVQVNLFYSLLDITFAQTTNC